MTNGLTRATFNRSALVRALSDSHPAIPDPKYDFGERLGQWLGFSDALTLFSVLKGATIEGTSITPSSEDPASLLAQARHNLSHAILHDGVFRKIPTGNPVRIPFPIPLPDATPESAADFSPYHRYYLAHQRDMNAAISGLRANARKALASKSTTGKQLADLDAAFEQFLIARERNLLGNIPILLGKRFHEHYAKHRIGLDNQFTDNPAAWIQPGSWLEAFCHDAQTLLIAELELRLKPVNGLIAAWLALSGNTNQSPPQ